MTPRLRSILLFGLVAALFSICLAKLAKQLVQDRGDISVYFNAARDLVDGRNPFREGWYLYPVLWAWLLIPLWKLGVGSFALIWGGLLGVCWIASFLLIRRLFPELRRHPHSAILLALPHMILFRWIWNGWGMGQVTLLLLAILLVALVLLEHGRGGLAALLVAFAGVIKVFPLYFGLLFCRRSRFRYALGIPVAAASFFALPALDLGVERFLELSRHQVAGHAAEGINQRLLWAPNHSPVPRVLRSLGCTSGAIISKAMLVWFVICTGVTVGLYRNDHASPEGKLWIALVFVSMVVTSPVAWGHYATFFVYPVAACLAFVCARPAGDPHRRRLVWTLIAMAVLLNVESSWVLRSDNYKALGAVPCGFALLWASLALTLARLPTSPTPAGSCAPDRSPAPPRPLPATPGPPAST